MVAIGTTTPLSSECGFELFDNGIALRSRRAERDQVVVVQVDAVCTKLSQLADTLRRRDGGADRAAEWVGTRVADGPEAECELI